MTTSQTALPLATGLDVGRVRGIIFDLDGVLIDSSDCHRLAFQQVFENFGIQNFEYSEYGGWRTAEVIEHVLHRAGHRESPETIVGLAREKSRLARRMIETLRPLAPGCESVLATLAIDYSLALASSGSRGSVDSFLQMSGAASLFGSVLSGDDVSAAKPNPEIYLRSAENLGLDVSECLVIEDAIAGVHAARAAGAMVAGIPGTCSESELRAAGAGCIVSHLREFAPMLARRTSGSVDPSLWTAVIPAAGRGSRLGFDRAKILYPVAGRPILDWLLDFLTPFCGRLLFVLSPDGAADVTAELERRIPGRFEVVLQTSPTGMGDAVGLALPQVQTPHVAIVWGDQVALRRESVETCLRLHQGPLQPDVTFPTLVRPQPYIHFDRDSAGRIAGLRQAREGDSMPETGESDAGFFCFSTGVLARLLDRMRSSQQGFGSQTREFNLLPVIPLAASQGRVLTPRIVQAQETVGINSAGDASGLQEFLRRPHGYTA